MTARFYFALLSMPPITSDAENGNNLNFKAEVDSYILNKQILELVIVFVLLDKLSIVMKLLKQKASMT